MSYHFTRRGFLKGTAVAAGVIVLSGTFKTNAYAANSKLDVAIVGVGGQGGAGHGFMKSENCVAMCDADEARMGKLDIAGAKKYTDWLKMFDAHPKMNMFWVATPDHTHFPVAYMAVTMGMGCYCEKPLVHDVWEARILAEATKKMKVPTQMGNQGHAGQGIRRMVEWIQAGAIGDVKEVHTWTNRPIWPQGIAQRPVGGPAPANVNWEAWIGTAPMRPYDKAYHPFNWRGWYDFGTGAIGDMACHTWDGVWWSMDAKFPLTAECTQAESRNSETYPNKQILKWTFGPSTEGFKRPGFVAYWYEKLKPPVPEELSAGGGGGGGSGKGRGGGGLPGSGSLFIGTKGKMLASGDYCDSAPLIPQSAMDDFKTHMPPQMPRSIGHAQELIEACRGNQPWDYPKSNFTYAGPMVEAMMLGNLAMRLDKKLEWDPVEMKCKGVPEADILIHKEYRKGFWELPASVTPANPVGVAAKTYAATSPAAAPTGTTAPATRPTSTRDGAK